jgi:hypothetical protein
MHPAWILAGVLVVCATCLLGLKLLRRPTEAPSLQALEALLAEERAAMRREFALALEQAAGIGEAIKRHRARIEGGTRGNPAAAAPALADLTAEQAATLPTPQQLEWVEAQNQRRRRG